MNYYKIKLKYKGKKHYTHLFSFRVSKPNRLILRSLRSEPLNAFHGNYHRTIVCEPTEQSQNQFSLAWGYMYYYKQLSKVWGQRKMELFKSNCKKMLCWMSEVLTNSETEEK